MISDEDLATALLAKITSSDLGQIDQLTEKRSSAGAANRLDPMSFVKRETPQNYSVHQIPGLNATGPTPQQQQKILEEANRMAEQLCPLPPPITLPPPTNKVIDNETSNSLLTEKLDNIATSLITINETLLLLVESLKKE
jgi:hypothetical protein